MAGLSSFAAEIALPVIVLAALGWLVARTDRIIHHAFPDLEWERNLGWLNIRAARRANRALRWVGYSVVVLLLDSLVGILWVAKGFPRLADWTDPWVMGELALRLPVLGLCLLIWIIYLGCGLLPRLRAEREAAAFRKFRAEMKADDEERASESPSRIHAPLPKPRSDAPTVTLVPNRNRSRHPPGG
jgi:type VI protein secretion system component VasK